MTSTTLDLVVQKILDSLSRQVPGYAGSEWDWKNCQGNVAACIICPDGRVHGRIWGTDKLKGRRYYDVAYRKASQVWITGYATNEFERLVFSDQVNYKEFGIELPDLVGWLGGQLFKLDEETTIYCGFSGFRGVTDIAVFKQAVAEALAG